MKIVNFTPGLGNQIFEYIFVQYLKKTFPQEGVYGYYNPKFLNKHNGLEVNKMFDVELPPESKWSNFVALMCRVITRVVPCVKATDEKYSANAIYYDGWWQNKRYFLDTIDSIKYYLPQLDETNKRLMTEIATTDSVSLHVRRGDYLEPHNAKQYGGICTIEYYIDAIDIVKKHFERPQFYIFSNDIEWCKENLPVENIVFVTNNTGANSWIDMYLMSHCKANIIANSSFSYWGALLNKKENLVVYPEKWTNSKTPDIFPDNWIPVNVRSKKRD